MKDKIKKFIDGFKFMVVLLVIEIIMFFICKGVVWLELVFHPYTHFGAMFLTFGQHIVFAVLGYIFAIYANAIIGGNKK
ncbi:hypothetical protein ABWK22_02285 [Gottfriedia acidiceleris]|uniref:hypothetical protein n=1 Tax=Gottfriedia acidiceleris TaxID=371036 RepID=UPI00339A74DD